MSQAVSLIEYIMAGLLDAKFTALQSTLFRNVVPAIIEAIPNPTLDDFQAGDGEGLAELSTRSILMRGNSSRTATPASIPKPTRAPARKSSGGSIIC